MPPITKEIIFAAFVIVALIVIMGIVSAAFQKINQKIPSVATPVNAAPIKGATVNVANVPNIVPNIAVKSIIFSSSSTGSDALFAFSNIALSVLGRTTPLLPSDYDMYYYNRGSQGSEVQKICMDGASFLKKCITWDFGVGSGDNSSLKIVLSKPEFITKIDVYGSVDEIEKECCNERLNKVVVTLYADVNATQEVGKFKLTGFKNVKNSRIYNIIDDPDYNRSFTFNKDYNDPKGSSLIFKNFTRDLSKNLRYPTFN
jgi:hypothetical protein